MAESGIVSGFPSHESQGGPWVFSLRGHEIRVDPGLETYPESYWRSAESGTWEPEIFDWLDGASSAGSSVLLDVGAASGIVTLYALSLGIRTVSIEPISWQARALRGNLAASNLSAEVIQAIVTGEQQAIRNERDHLLGSIMEPELDGAAGADILTVPDLLRLARCSPGDGRLLIKMDIEGAEFAALDRSALRRLRDYRAIVYLSLHPGAMKGLAQDASLATHGYWRLHALSEVVLLRLRLLLTRARVHDMRGRPASLFASMRIARRDKVWIVEW